GGEGLRACGGADENHSSKQTPMNEKLRNRLEVTGAFLKLGALGFGAPAIWALIQAEVQERRAWLTKERFIEGLALVNALPGAPAMQMCIFVGHERAGWWAGVFLLAGCAGVALHHSRRVGLSAVLVAACLIAAERFAEPMLTGLAAGAAPGQPGLWDIGVFFFKVGAVTFGGGMTIIVFVQD